MELPRVEGVVGVQPELALRRVDDQSRRSSTAPLTEPAPVIGDRGPSAKSDTPAARLSTHYAQFEVDSETGVLRVKVIDSTTGQIVRSIPPEELDALERQIQRVLDMYRQARLFPSAGPATEAP